MVVAMSRAIGGHADVKHHRLKPVASDYDLKPDFVDPLGRLLDNLETIVGHLGPLILDILPPPVVGNATDRYNPISAPPQILTSISLA